MIPIQIQTKDQVTLQNTMLALLQRIKVNDRNYDDYITLSS